MTCLIRQNQSCTQGQQDKNVAVIKYQEQLKERNIDRVRATSKCILSHRGVQAGDHL